jgi:ATP-dependent protease HslVU (ClpYQ) peptidase subunit
LIFHGFYDILNIEFLNILGKSMTTIIGIQGQDYALVCSDSRISTMDEGGFTSQITTLGSNSTKIAENNKYLLGAAGDMRAINILHHAFTPPTLPAGTTGKKLDNFITTKFVPALRECFEKQGYASPENESATHIAQHESTIMTVVAGSIYVIDGDYSWTSDINGVYAMGTGSSYALGALQVLCSSKVMTVAQAKKVALKAIAVSAKYDPYTGGPFHCYVQEKF